MNNIPAGRTSRVPDPEGYEIRVTGHLARRWDGFFDGMSLVPQDDGTTVIHGPVADQSALHGVLRKLSDLGLTLVSVTPAVTDADHLARRPLTERPPNPRRNTT